MAQESSFYQIEDLLKTAASQDGRYYRFIDNEKLTSGIYELQAGDEDLQNPHEWDELYYVLEGEAVLKAGDKSYNAVPGSILFVAADVDHKFVDIKRDLKILVFFSKK